MPRGFFGMQGASSLGCGNNWTGPSETQQVRTSAQDQRTGTLKMQRTMASPLPPPAPEQEEAHPQMGRMDLGKEIVCTTCAAKKKALKDAGWNPQATTMRLMGTYQLQTGSNRPFLGRKSSDDTEMGCPSCGLEGARRQAAALGQVCATKKPVGLRCQKTASGDVVCSDGVVYSGECPNTPDVNIPGIAEVDPATNAPKAPAAPGVTPIAPIPGAAAPAAPAASSGMDPLAVGALGLVGVGLLYLALK